LSRAGKTNAGRDTGFKAQTCRTEGTHAGSTGNWA
jgi:hypothetical protein